MQRPVFAANWKMHHGPTAARAFVASFLARFSPRSDRTVALFPPAISVHVVVAARADRRDITVGVQNIHTEEKGAFTGETSAPMARDAGAELVLVGHSERRHVFGETDAQTARKCAVAVANRLTPILCVGETLEQREAGVTDDVVLAQLRAGLAELDTYSIASLAIAYEPVWAIGTGRNATPDDAARMHGVIRGALIAIAGAEARSVPVLYGGSVNRQNAAALLAARGVDGLLVGGASLDPEAWAAIAGT
ncbi:MAG: triose-phosphate isomerase [Gemmatimonadaceae bacterium]